MEDGSEQSEDVKKRFPYNRTLISMLNNSTCFDKCFFGRTSMGRVIFIFRWLMC